MNRNKVEGEFDQAKGKAKQALGDLTDDENLQAEGTWDRVKGGVKEAVGDVQDAVEDTDDRK